MKKINKFKIASFLAAFALTATTFIKVPDCLIFFGEPESPLDEI